MLTDPLSSLLASLECVWRQVPATPRTLTNIQWRADACDAGSILFFQRFDDGRSDAEIYRRYLADSRFAVLVIDRPLACFSRLPDRAIYVVAPADWPQIVGRFCDLCYPLETPRPQFVGVTGTNGKTTTVKYLEAILIAAGRRVLSIGTLGVFLDGERLLETGFTSPPQIELRRLLYAHRSRYEVAIMEVSSHALDQGRVAGLAFQCAGWTNFTQDHLDYHRDEAAYFAAKARILELIRDGGLLYCSSAAVVSRLATQRPVTLLEPATLAPEVIAAKPFLALEHNRRNYALASALADSVLGSGERADWQQLHPVAGRFECWTYGNRTFVIDFAHTPNALETILIAIRAGFPGAHVLTLFGCGGERDRSKRPLMGAAAARYSDHCIVTSDNARREDPERIIAEILAGMPAAKQEAIEAIVERAAAVARLFERLASRPADEPWVALIAGKGHERYLERNGRREDYSDQDEVERHLRRLGWV